MVKAEILKEMQKKALSYVPEWRLSMDSPDIGSALAYVYGWMISGSWEKLNYLPYKNQIAFFNSLDADMLPAVPAKGYVAFRLVNDEVEGEEVPAGMTVLSPAANSREEAVSYETLDDIYVTPAEVNCVLQISRHQDFIGTLDFSNLKEEGVFLFANQSENLQSHRLYFCHDDALSISEEGKITVSFFQHREALPEQFLKMLADTNEAVFSYSSENGYVPFANKKQEGSGITFLIKKGDPPFVRRVQEGKESFWICCEIRRLESLEHFGFDAMSIASSCNRKAFDCIYANGLEMNREDFFPFGERLAEFNEVYFLSEDILRKKGADITVSFNLDFARVPLDYLETEEQQFEWVMRRADFKPDLEFDVTIQEVVWEYFNGYGWAALFEKNEYADIFSVKEGTVGQYKKMHFVCPMDMSPILVNAREGCYIRARITKINNLYKMRGSFISPVMDQVHLQYDYTARPVSPQLVLAENNRAMEKYRFGSSLFYGLPQEEEALYLGFDVPPVGGPIKMLFDFAKRNDRRNQTLLWEYAAGKDAWRELDLVDETENMSRTGIVTMMGSQDFSKRLLYGFEKYWIRILDLSAGYTDRQMRRKYPCLCGLYMNAVRIRQADRAETEYFHMEVYQENMQFQLLHGSVISCRLMVDEAGILSREELEALGKAHRMFPEYRKDGELLRAWVLWEQVPDFLNSKSNDRHYLLSANEGIIRFGNGRTGRIPPANKEDNIRVVYRTGGGAFTNVEAGAISQLGSSAGFINEVTNPKRLTGGSDAESLKDALRRNAAVLRHQNMAVTERDFEEIALDASRSLKRVKCFCGYDDKERKKSGAVTLVLVQQNVKDGQVRFYDIKTEVENYMEDKVYTGLLDRGSFYCIPPSFVELCVRAEVVADSLDIVFQVKKQILERLEQFLDPLTGNFNGTGWEIGTLPNSLQVQNAISDIEGLTYIKNLYISAFLGENTDRTEVDLHRIRERKYILPLNGTHEILVRMK